MCKQLVVEATIVGLATILVGVCVQELLKKTTLKVQCETPCDWNKNYVREIGLFLSGFITPIFLGLSITCISGTIAAFPILVLALLCSKKLYKVSFTYPF